MDKKSRGIIAVLVLLIVAVIVYLCSTYAKEPKTNQVQNNTITANKTTENKVEVNKVEENKVETVPENVVENIPETPAPTPDPVVEENQNTNNEVAVPEDTELQSNNDEEKAIAIAKKDWGDTTGFSFDVTSCNADGSYTVRVRNEGAVVMEWYKVYPKTGKCIRGEY